MVMGIRSRELSCELLILDHRASGTRENSRVKPAKS